MPEPAPADPIRLDYALTRDDLRDAVAAQQNRRLADWFVPVVTLAGLAVFVSTLSSAEVWKLPARVAAIMVAVALVGSTIVAGLAALLARPARKLFYDFSANLVLQGNPRLFEPRQATLTDTALHFQCATSNSTIAWVHFPLYIETDRSFILLTANSSGASSVVLPKRGLVEADPARLRAMLASHLREMR